MISWVVEHWLGWGRRRELKEFWRLLTKVVAAVIEVLELGVTSILAVRACLVFFLMQLNIQTEVRTTTTNRTRQHTSATTLVFPPDFRRHFPL